MRSWHQLQENIGANWIEVNAEGWRILYSPGVFIDKSSTNEKNYLHLVY